jgi:hypothetical protein
VDRAKIEVIENLHPPTNVKGFVVFYAMRGSIVVLSGTSSKLLDPSQVCCPRILRSNSQRTA